MTLAATNISFTPMIGNRRVFDVTFKHEIQEQGKSIRLWIPLPLNREFQQLLSDIKVSGNCKNYSVLYGAIPTLYAEFGAGEKPKLDVNFRIATIERTTDFSKVKFDANEKLAPDIEQYLKATKHIQTTGIVKQRSDEIIKGIKGDLEKARAIYEWVARNMERDNSVKGCGIGDATAILESGKLLGKCTDINSVFVALARSAGIPAREMFGIRLGASRMHLEIGKADSNGLAVITGGQHCRAEFYLKGYGWIPVDPADVAKVKLAEKLGNDDPKIAQLRDYLFGNWEMCWAGFNIARDFVLNPEPAEHPLNNFNYPYGEVDDNILDYYDTKGFSYNYFSQEIK